MAQIIFSDLMNPYHQPGNDGDNQAKFGKYAEPKHFKHMYAVKYESVDMNPVEFLDWIAQFMTGIVMVSKNHIWFNSDADEATLLLAFSGNNEYGDSILWKWHKNPNNKRFESHLPYNGEWSY